MDLQSFKQSVKAEGPPDGVRAELRALWYAAKGDWHQAHEIVQAESGADAAWVHAYLHRVEGDLGNAGYWYTRARRPKSSRSLEREWEEITGALL